MIRQKSKLAMAISGGGAKGAFAVGVIKKLFESYRSSGWFDIIGGTSAGAIIAPFAAMLGTEDRAVREEALQRLVHFYSNVKTRDILRPRSILKLLFRRDSFFETTPLRRLLTDHFPPEWFTWLKGSRAPHCYVVYTDYQSGEKVVVSPKDSGVDRGGFIDAVMASASVPILMKATRIGGNPCYDGGVRDLLPFATAIDLGAETIIPVFLDPRAFPESAGRLRRMDRIFLRTLNIFTDETLRNDDKMARLVNSGIRLRNELSDLFAHDPWSSRKLEELFRRPEFASLLSPRRRLLRLVLDLRPDEPLTENAFKFDPERMQRWMKLGEAKAGEVISQDPFADA